MPNTDETNETGGMFPHNEGVNIDRKDGMSDADDTVVAGEGQFADPNEYPLDYNWGVKTYGGNDEINLRNVDGVENRIDAGDGNDRVYDSPHNDTIDLGSGDDIAEMTTGMGRVDGGAGDDTIKVYIEEFMDPNYQPPYDPGGPFWLNIGGGSNKGKAPGDNDTVQLYMSADRIENTQYDEVIAQAFDDFKAGNIGSEFLMPRGELHLGEVTAAAGLERVDILLQTDVENLQIINQDSGEVVYDSNNPIEIV
jgi:hypothetical protein